MSDQIKACPFCGSDSVKIRPVTTDVFTDMFRGLCSTCGIHAKPYYSEAEAVAAWNRRASGWMPIHSLDMAERCLVLVVTFDGEIGIGKYLSNEWQLHWFGDSERNEMDVAHWQPLPEPPKEND